MTSEHLIKVLNPNLDVERQKLRAFQSGYKDGKDQIHPQPHNYPSYTVNYSVGWKAGDRFAHKEDS